MSAWTGGLAAALAATTGAQALATLAVFVLPVLAPAAAPDLGVPARWIGYQVAAVYLPAALVSALAGGALRRFGLGLLVNAPHAKLPIQSPWVAITNRQTEIARKLAAELALPPAQRSRAGMGPPPRTVPPSSAPPSAASTHRGVAGAMGSWPDIGLRVAGFRSFRASPTIRSVPPRAERGRGVAMSGTPRPCSGPGRAAPWTSRARSQS